MTMKIDPQNTPGLPSSEEMERILEWLWLEACHCTDGHAEDCHAHRKMEAVKSYLHFLSSRLSELEGERDKYKRVLEFLLYQSGHKDGNIGEAEMKLIEKALSPNPL